MKKRTLFRLSNIQQWSDLQYNYLGSDLSSDVGNDKSSQDHQFEETYHLGIDYAVFSHRLANGSLEVDLGLDQNIETERGGQNRSGTSSGFNLQYLLDGIAFERRPYPITFFSNRTQTRVNAPFTENYDSTNSSLGAGISLRNLFVPLRINYLSTESETDGLALDRSQNFDELSLDSIFFFRELSKTSLRIRTNSGETSFGGDRAPLKTENYDLEGRNTLTWGGEVRKNSLDSRYIVRRDRGASTLRSVQWGESLRLQLGKALSTGFSYGYSKNDTPTQDRRGNRGKAWLEHRLFRSLTTSLHWAGNEDDYSTGNSQNWQGLFSLAYGKSLPRQSSLSLSYSHSYGEMDRDFDDQRLFVVGEVLTVGLFDNFLANPDILTDTIVVFNADRSTIFVEGVDYRVNQVGRRTELIFLSGGIVVGEILSVDYFYLVNSSLEYSTTTNSLSASLSLFKQRYILHATFSETGEDLISGEEDVSPLSQQTVATLRFESNLEGRFYGASYQYIDSTISTDRTAEGFFSITKDYRGGRLGVRLTERYSTTKQKEGLDGVDTGTEGRNSFSLHGDYRTKLSSNSTLSLRGHFIDSRGQDRDQDDISFGMILESRWHKFEFSLLSDVTWQIFEQGTEREDSLSVKVRRYF